LLLRNRITVSFDSVGRNFYRKRSRQAAETLCASQAGNLSAPFNAAHLFGPTIK